MSNLINGKTPEEIKRWISSRVKCETCTKEHEFGCEYGERTEDCQMCIDALALIEHLEAQQPKWISVEARLPKEAGKYIVCTRKKAVYCTAFRFFHGKGYFATDSTTHITHWMPLPQPPEEDA